MALMEKSYLFGSEGRWSRLTPLYLLVPGVLLYFLIALGPSMATAVLSFTDISGLRGASFDWIGFDNYREFLFEGLASRDNIAATGRALRGARGEQSCLAQS